MNSASAAALIWSQLQNFGFSRVQHQLRAHPVLAAEKPRHPEFGAGSRSGKPVGRFTHRHACDLAFDLALVARFDLQRLVREPELQKGQPCGRMAQRFDAGNDAGQANRVTVHLCRRL